MEFCQYGKVGTLSYILLLDSGDTRFEKSVTGINQDSSNYFK